MPVSKPMQVVAIRFSPEEKARLEELARTQHVTFSHAVREGVKLYLAEAREKLSMGDSLDVA